jgi:hypothetical protein
MTYWPFASPSVFAASKHTHADRVQISHDGVEPAKPDRQHVATTERTYSSVAGSGEKPDPERELADDIPVKEAEQSAELGRNPARQSAEEDINGEIIAIRVTRSGHMFATVTRTTLTIWQTKARYDAQLYLWRLTKLSLQLYLPVSCALNSP